MKRKDKAETKARAAKVVQEVEKVHGQGMFGVMTRFGEVQIQSVTQIQDQGVDLVEVRLAGQSESGEAHFRIINPPLMVRDPDGSMHEDPVLALAEVVARFGGRRK